MTAPFPHCSARPCHHLGRTASESQGPRRATLVSLVTQIHKVPSPSPSPVGPLPTGTRPTTLFDAGSTRARTLVSVSEAQSWPLETASPSMLALMGIVAV